MKLWMMLLTCSVLSLGCVACGGDDEEDEEGGELPEVDCGSGSVPTYDDVAAFDKCATCHDSSKSGAARQQAPATINFDTFEGAEAHATKAAAEVNEGAMPPKASGITLTADEKQTLYRWALCGAME